MFKLRVVLQAPLIAASYCYIALMSVYAQRLEHRKALTSVVIMRTIADTFLELRTVARSVRGEGNNGDGPDPVVLCDQTRDAYLAQQDISEVDAKLAAQLFASLRALVPSKSQSDAGVDLHLAEAAHESERPSSPALMAVAPVLTIVLIGSVVIGTLTLSLGLAIVLGLVGYLAAGGKLFGFSADTLPLWLRGADRVGACVIDGKGSSAANPDIDRLEDAFRQADVLLARLRVERPAEVAPKAEVPLEEGSLQFVQDLAEAELAGDGDYLVKLVHRRLPAILQRLGLRLALLADGDEDCFVVDLVTDPNRTGTTTTVRP
ncbi:MAG: hypothetical protein U1E43_09265, partial [Rhodospirillales bacterium]